MSFNPWAACKGNVAQAAVRNTIADQEVHPVYVPRYPETVNLPFNFSALKNDFTFTTGCGNQQPGTGYWIIIQGGNVIVEPGQESALLPHGTLPDGLLTGQPPLCIGTWRGEAVHVLEIGRDAELPPSLQPEAFNAANDLMDIGALTLAGLGKQILHWENRSRFCARCGGTTGRMSESWGKRCTVCYAEHFPHIHPCAIILVKRGNELLLTRKKEWNPGRYSLVAGFLDFGESLEECAMREVREETGIDICNVRYVGSQNWPFPAQMMAGFVAEYAGGDIRVDYCELEDARWFSADNLPDLPARRSIARWIIDNCK